MKRIFVYFSVVLFTMLFQNTYSRTGQFFNVTATGTPAQINITACLDGQGSLSCQTFIVSGLTLSITTTIPNHVYPAAGIKINTPGYTLGNCIPISNGYCLFSVSNTSSASISISPLALIIASGHDNNSNAPLMVISHNGGTNWGIVSTTISGLTHAGNFNATSCAGGNSTAAICTAAGQDYYSGAPLLALSVDGGNSWTVPSRSISGLTNSGDFKATSCTGSGSNAACTAVGQDDSSGAPLLVFTKNRGSSWSIVSTISGLTHSGDFKATHCVGSGSTAICTVAGQDFNSGAPLLVASYDGGKSWSIPSASISGLSNFGVFRATHCTGSGSTAICVAVGQDYQYGAPLLVLTTNGGGHWSLPPHTAPTNSGEFMTASCTGNGANAICIAAGQDYNSGAPLLVQSVNGGKSWTFPTITGLTNFGYFHASSCSGSGLTAICIAAGQNYHSRSPLLVMSKDGGASWSIMPSISNLPSLGDINAANCSGSGTRAICTAAGQDDFSGAPLLLLSQNGAVTWVVASTSIPGLTHAGVFYGNGGIKSLSEWFPICKISDSMSSKGF